MIIKGVEAREGPLQKGPPRDFNVKTECFYMIIKSVEARGGPIQRGPPRDFMVKTACLLTIYGFGGPRGLGTL